MKRSSKSRKLHHSGKIYALKVLKRFSEILNVSQITNLKIIATAVLREASDARSFTEEVEKLFQKKKFKKKTKIEFVNDSKKDSFKSFFSKNNMFKIYKCN